jgi:hypothetical protein
MPLKLYWHSGRGDNFSTATQQGEQDALAVGYHYVRREGFVSTTSSPRRVRLELYYSHPREDNFSVSTTWGKTDAQKAGYTFIRTEGYVLPEWL